MLLQGHASVLCRAIYSTAITGCRAISILQQLQDAEQSWWRWQEIWHGPKTSEELCNAMSAKQPKQLSALLHPTIAVLVALIIWTG